MAAAENGHWGVCDYLISRGADITLVDSHGMLIVILGIISLSHGFAVHCCQGKCNEISVGRPILSATSSFLNLV